MVGNSCRTAGEDDTHSCTFLYGTTKTNQIVIERCHYGIAFTGMTVAEQLRNSSICLIDMTICAAKSTKSDIVTRYGRENALASVFVKPD